MVVYTDVTMNCYKYTTSITTVIVHVFIDGRRQCCCGHRKLKRANGEG